jgi:hypothetical protein
MYLDLVDGRHVKACVPDFLQVLQSAKTNPRGSRVMFSFDRRYADKGVEWGSTHKLDTPTDLILPACLASWSAL